MRSQLLPTGMVTLMFTDIEGSTRLLAALGERYVEVLAQHRQLLRAATAAAGGAEVDTQGDAFFMVFPNAGAALAAAAGTQRALAGHDWPASTSLRVRIGLHTGRPIPTDEGYVGIDLHRGARICAAGHGGQVVLSEDTYEALDRVAIDGVSFRPLGAHRLKDLDQPQTLFDLEIAGLDNRFPPLRSIGSRPTNLPPELPDLIGRGSVRAALRQLIRTGPDRLVTLTGPGGTGKTTLATRVAADLLTDHADGAFVVLLAPLTSSDGVAAAIASALQLREQVGRTYADVLCDYLAEREMLLLLDNFEHVAEAAPLVVALLAAARRIRVIVTSRLALRVPGEREFPVPALAVAADPTSPSRVPPAAVEFFAQRARLVSPTFQLDAHTEPAVTQICARLDGLPLAIELAAARVRLMSPAAMLTRLERPLELAAHGPRHAPLRQQALRATIDWSYDLLRPDEQRTLVRLGVFAAPFTIEAAEEVCDAGLDDLAGLLDQSLLHSTAVDGVGTAGRLGMLETIRAYARDRLHDSGERVALRERHAAWCLNFAAGASSGLLGGGHEERLPRFEAERDELRAALDFLLASGRGNDALQLAVDLAVFWDICGLYTEGRAHLEAALDVATCVSPLVLARAMLSIGRMTLIQGEIAPAKAALQRSLELHRSLDDARGITVCLTHLAWAHSLEPDGATDAHRFDAESIANARSCGDRWSIAMSLNDSADRLLHQEDVSGGDLERTRALLEEAVGSRRQLQKRELSIILGNSGELALAQGRIDDAEAILEETLVLSLDIGFSMIIADARRFLARIAYVRHNLDRADSLLLDSLDRGERMADPFGIAACGFGLSLVAAARGDTATAGRRQRDAQAVVDRTGIRLNPFARWADVEPVEG